MIALLLRRSKIPRNPGLIAIHMYICRKMINDMFKYSFLWVNDQLVAMPERHTVLPKGISSLLAATSFCVTLPSLTTRILS